MSSAKPTYISRIPRGTDTSVGDVGADLLGLPLKPQGRQVVALLEARRRGGTRLYTECAIQMPRRSAKTTSIFSVLLGRCSTTPAYRIVVSAQDGVRASSILRDFMEILEARGFEDDGHGRLFWSNGQEKIRFANGSIIWCVSPKPGAFRSAAADVVLFEESGELDSEQSDALLSAALPLLDTRPDGQIIITGTPSVGRAGMLWDALAAGRAGKPGTGVLDYSLADNETIAIYDEDDPDADPVLDEALLRRVHPGIGTLTSIEKMRERFDKMQLPQFEREYCGRFSFDHTTHAIDPEVWAANKILPTDRPARVGVAYDVAIDGSSASIAYAWRVDGIAYVEVVEHRAGTSWLPSQVHKALGKHRGAKFAYDSIGSNLDPATALARFKPTPKADRLTMKDILGASQRFTANLHDGTLRHFGQADLDAAVENASWRVVQNSGRAFGQRVKSGAAINPLVACSLALWSYDRGRDRKPLTIAV